MAIIRPSELPNRASPVASEKIPTDNGSDVAGTTIEKLVLAGRPTASQAEAEAGVQSTKAMTPLTTKQAINALGDIRFASAAQGDLADAAVRTVLGGANTTVDSTDPNNPVISYDGSAVTVEYQTALASIRNRKKVQASGSLKFPDYDALLSTYGYSYLYPQGLAVDWAAPDGAELFVVYCPPDTDADLKHWIVVYDFETSAIKGYFSAGYGTSSEGLAIEYSGGNRYLKNRLGNGGDLGEFNITTLPVDGAVLSSGATKSVGFVFQMGSDGIKTVIETNPTPLGTYNRRNQIVVWDAALDNRISTVMLPVYDRNGRSDEPLRDLLPKAQGLAINGDVIGTSIGALWRPVDGPGLPYALGFALYSTRGDLIERQLYDPVQFEAILSAEGYSVNRLENEGITISPAGRVFTLFVIRSTTGGDGLGQWLLFEERSPSTDAIDFATAETFAPSQPASWQIRKSFSGDGVLLPLTGEVVTTLADLCDYVIAAEITFTQFDSSHITGIVGADGSTVLSTGQMVTLRLRRGNTVLVEFGGNGHQRSIEYVEGTGFGYAGPSSWVANKNGTNQTLGAATNTKVTFTNESQDRGSVYDAANSRVTPKWGQVLEMTGHITFSSGLTAGDLLQVYIYKNGSTFRRTQARAQGTADQTVEIRVLSDLGNGTDYYEVYAYSLGAGVIAGSGGLSWFEGRSL